jgi:hypothetical protein
VPQPDVPNGTVINYALPLEVVTFSAGNTLFAAFRIALPNELQGKGGWIASHLGDTDVHGRILNMQGYLSCLLFSPPQDMINISSRIPSY